MTKYGAALEILEPVLGSKYVGAEARLLQDQIQKAVRGRIGDCTREIEADPQNATAYSHRAQYYAYLDDRANANADMRRWSAILSEGFGFAVRHAAEPQACHQRSIRLSNRLLCRETCK